VLSLAATTPAITAGQPAAVRETAPAFDSGRAWEHLRQFVALGPRPAGSHAIEQARTYLKGQLVAMGVTVREQAWDDQTPIGTVHMVNLIATIPAAIPSPIPSGAPSRTRLAIAGHYDTKLFRQFRFVGANDGGSSAAFLLELARVLKARRNAMTIELLFLDGEEAVVEWQGTDHTYGSRHYVDAARRDGSLAGLKGLILVDMIGDRDLRIRRDTNSTTWLTDAVWDAAKRQKLGDYFVGDTTTVEDDHLPFLQAGVPSVDIIDLDYQPWHTAQDTLDAVSARSLQVVGDAVLAALPRIESDLLRLSAK
jgi:Zn-dependent M28 family amino/carboxypeptidase